MRGLDTSQAWRLLNDPSVAESIGTEAYMDLCRQAGYSEYQTQKAGCRWAAARLDRGLDA